ncbi:MAG TPA: hypothetical protein VHF05_00675 [Candidatus Paceibacterota bacterium]|nr:hypothetical protein [Candidatus Paceibacterota bacterium]
MADEPKKEEAKGGIPSSGQALSQLGIVLAILIMAQSLLDRLFGAGGANILHSPLFLRLEDFFNGFKVVSVIASIGLGAGVWYLVRGINEIRAAERAALYPEPEAGGKEVIVNSKWQRVIDHLESDNASDWKLAIIEADILLDEMLDAMGYQGDTVGEKLKQIERSDFVTIDYAWEAHKVRNMIAHEGADFTLTKKEAIRVIELYKKVFEEFFLI